MRARRLEERVASPNYGGPNPAEVRWERRRRRLERGLARSPASCDPSTVRCRADQNPANGESAQLNPAARLQKAFVFATRKRWHRKSGRGVILKRRDISAPRERGAYMLQVGRPERIQKLRQFLPGAVRVAENHRTEEKNGGRF